MELKDYLSILWRRKWVILLTLVVTVAVVSIGTRLTTPVYQATAILRIAVSSGGPLSFSDYTYADQLMNTYVEMATRRPVLDELMQSRHSPLTFQNSKMYNQLTDIKGGQH